MSDAEDYQPDPAEIAADLADTGTHVDESLTDDVAAEQRDEIEALTTDAETPVFVLAVPLDHDSELSANQLVSLVHRELDEDGVYFVSSGSTEFGWRLESTSYGVSTDNENNLATYVAADRYPSDLGMQLVDTLELFDSGKARQEYEKLSANREQNESGESRTETQSGEPAQILGMDVPVAIGGVLVLLAAVLTAWALTRRRRQSDGLELKRRALRRISSAQTRQWRRRAESETAALGDRIRELEIGQQADGDAWTAAIDHYQAATAVLDRSTDAADSIGAIVLTRRGDDALEQAVAGRSWTPTASCFFDPLHGTATTNAPWKTSAGSREVPCCTTCRRHIDRRREPRILDLPTADTVVHYMDSDAEPWASTGYGALDPDLLHRLHRLDRR